MSQVEMFAQQAEQNVGPVPQSKGQLKERKDGTIDHESRARQGINVIFKEPIYKLVARIQDKPYFRKPETLGGDPKRRNQ